MEGAAAGWEDMSSMPAPSLPGPFDVGMAFTEAEIDFILIEGCITAKLLAAYCPAFSRRIILLTLLALHQSCWIQNTMPVCAAYVTAAHDFAGPVCALSEFCGVATCAGGHQMSPPLHDTAYEPPQVRCIPRNTLAVSSIACHASLQLLAQALPGLPFPASMAASMQQQPHSQFLTDFGPDAGLVGSGFGIDPASELVCQDTASDPNAKRRRAPERRSGARSTSKYRGVTHHCRTGRHVLLFVLAIFLV